MVACLLGHLCCGIVYAKNGSAMVASFLAPRTVLRSRLFFCACVHVCMCACVHLCMCACVHVCLCLVHAYVLKRASPIHARSKPCISLETSCKRWVVPDPKPAFRLRHHSKHVSSLIQRWLSAEDMIQHMGRPSQNLHNLWRLPSFRFCVTGMFILSLKSALVSPPHSGGVTGVSKPRLAPH